MSWIDSDTMTVSFDPVRSNPGFARTLGIPTDLWMFDSFGAAPVPRLSRRTTAADRFPPPPGGVTPVPRSPIPTSASETTDMGRKWQGSYKVGPNKIEIYDGVIYVNKRPTTMRASSGDWHSLKKCEKLFWR